MDKLTKTLLGCGVLAGPLYIGVGLLQMAIRDGFNISHHALSLLSNGDLGWIQVLNFIVAGLLVLLCAVGVRRALHPGRGGTWGPSLLGIYGTSLLAAGIFAADPAMGFPAGTPEGNPVTISAHGIVHLAAGGIGFLALTAACFVFARRFASLKQRNWMVFSIAAGVLFFGSFAAVASGGGKPIINLTFATSVALVWLWLASVASKLREVKR